MFPLLSHARGQRMKIEQISPDEAENLCRIITKDLPEYFGLVEANEKYVEGVKDHINFAIAVQGNFVGLLSLSFPYPKASQIYWMGILRRYQEQGLGKLLVHAALDYAKNQGATSMTVETLSKAEADENYLKTYGFYETMGFEPLFDLKPEGYEWTMVYMAVAFPARPASESSQSALFIRKFEKNDIAMIVERFAFHHWQKPVAVFEKYLQDKKREVVIFGWPSIIRLLRVM